MQTYIGILINSWGYSNEDHIRTVAANKFGTQEDACVVMLLKELNACMIESGAMKAKTYYEANPQEKLTQTAIKRAAVG